MMEKAGNYYYHLDIFIKEHARIFQKNLERSIWKKQEKARIN